MIYRLTEMIFHLEEVWLYQLQKVAHCLCGENSRYRHLGNFEKLINVL